MKQIRALLLINQLLALFAGFGYAAEIPGGINLGRNFGGEECRATTDLTEARPSEFVCGQSMQPVGKLQLLTLGTTLASDESARRNQIYGRAKAIASTLAISSEQSCDAGRFLGEGNSRDTVLFLCVSKSTSWPQILLVSGVDRTIYQAEGLPTMLPVLSTAITVASNRQAAPEEVAAGRDVLASLLPPQLVRLSAGDFVRFSEAIDLARYFSGAGDFGAAERALRTALDLNLEIFGAASTPAGLALMELALQVSNQGRFDEADGLFRRAATIIQASTAADARARYNSYLALHAANRRDFVSALAYARQATAERRAEIEVANGTGTGFSGLPTVSSGELAHSLRIEAEMALRLDDITAAETAAEEALWIVSLEPGLPLWWRPDTIALMAEINESQGRTAIAERNHLDVIDLRRRLFGESAPVVMAELRAGRFYVNQQLYAQAVEHFRAAMAIIEQNTAARTLIVADQIIPFIAAVTAIPDDSSERSTLNREVFRAVQLINSGVADQAIARASARVATSDSMLAELVQDSQNAQRDRDRTRLDLTAEFAKPDNERSSERETQLRQNLTRLSALADELVKKIRGAFPNYTRLAAPGHAELSEVQAELKTGEAFVSYVIGVRESYGLFVTQNGMTAHRLDTDTKTLGDKVAALRRALQPQFGGLPEFPLGNAHALYQQLLDPFAAELTEINHLIVAPGGVLSNLPFGLLVRSEPKKNDDYRGAAWLIRSMAVSQVPSPRALVLLRNAARERLEAPRAFLGLGNPMLSGGTNATSSEALNALSLACREQGPMPASLLRSLTPLPDSADEVRAVARALGGDSNSILLGMNATEIDLRQRTLSQYRVLYFATHGLLPGELHCQTEPGLVLSPPLMDASVTEADGLLEVSEIATMKLNADLVVLSACNTAVGGGNSLGGDALEGLADAFFAAGARAVLASHWEIPSAATTQMMTGVFQRYGRERIRGLAEALRQSQLELIASEATAHPFNWAAFTLIGPGEFTDEVRSSVQQNDTGGQL